MSTATFKIRRKELLSILKKFKALMKTARRKEATLEVTIVNSGLRLVIPGVEIPIAATTSGSAKFTLPLQYFEGIVDTEKKEILEFSLTDERLKLRDFSWHVSSTFFENDRKLRSINLPVNYKLVDIVRLYLSEKYTIEEIEFNNLKEEVVDAINKLNGDIDKVASILKKYGFRRIEIEEFITVKLK